MNLNQLYRKLISIEGKFLELERTIDQLAFIRQGSEPELTIEDLQQEYLELAKDKRNWQVLAERALLTNLVDVESSDGNSSERVTLKEVQLSLEGNRLFLGRLKNLRDRYYETFNADAYVGSSENTEPNFDPSVLDETISAVEERFEYLDNVFNMACFQVDVEGE